MRSDGLSTKREFVDLELDLDTDATPHPHPSSDFYFNSDGHPEFGHESPTESTPSPREDDSHGVYTHILEAGTLINGDSKEDGPISLSLIRALGRGAFSSVWLAQDNSDTANGRLVAVKVAPRDNHVTMLTFEREAEVLRVSNYSIPTSYVGHFMYVAFFLFSLGSIYAIGI
jgi:hypothetical protein